MHLNVFLNQHVDVNGGHFDRVGDKFEASICNIMSVPINEFRPRMAVEVLTKLMNSMVVNVMSGSLHGSYIIFTPILTFSSVHSCSGRLLCFSPFAFGDGRSLSRVDCIHQQTSIKLCQG
jgi:hypothetical protein